MKEVYQVSDVEREQSQQNVTQHIIEQSQRQRNRTELEQPEIYMHHGKQSGYHVAETSGHKTDKTIKTVVVGKPRNLLHTVIQPTVSQLFLSLLGHCLR